MPALLTLMDCCSMACVAPATNPHLVDGHAVRLAHLVELVDETHAAVRQHQRAALQRPLARARIAMHRRRQTDRRGAFSRRVAARERENAPTRRAATFSRRI